MQNAIFFNSQLDLLLFTVSYFAIGTSTSIHFGINSSKISYQGDFMKKSNVFCTACTCTLNMQILRILHTDLRLTLPILDSNRFLCHK